MIDLSNRKYVQTALFCKVIATPSAYQMSDHDEIIAINGYDYMPLGQFLSITDTSSDLQMTNSEVSITISGVAGNVLGAFLADSVKGGAVTVFRAFFDPATNQLLSIGGNPTGKFKGIVNNYSINETYDGGDQSSTITLICKSQVGQVERVTGRRTNPADEKKFFPADKSMNRVPSLANAKINFGGV